jgi:thiamine biosynthesis lipoprotein
MIRCKPLLGTYVEISIDEEDCNSPPIEINEAIDCAFAAIELVQQLMGFHDPKSELTQINTRGHLETIHIHEWTFQVLSTAQDLFESSQGIFDCSVGSKLVQAGLLPRHQPLNTRDAGQFTDLILSSPTQVSCSKPLQLDLGGIAKGFAVDKAVETLKLHGISSGAVSAGGDLRVFGVRAQEIHIRNPSNPSQVFRLGSLENGAIATSGLYYKKESQKMTRHIVNPMHMEQMQLKGSYSVIAPECIHADALTKVLAISKNESHPCFKQYSAQAIGINP